MDINYWRTRAELLEQSVFKDTITYEKHLMSVYEEQVKQIEKEIHSFLLTYATEKGLTFQEASKNLDFIEKADYNATMKKLTAKYKETGSDKIKAKIKEIEARQILTRLDAIRTQIEMRMNILAEDCVNDMGEYLQEVYDRVYYLHESALKEEYNKQETPIEEMYILAELLKNPFTGIIFIERIWRSVEKLNFSVIETLQTGLVQGKNVTQIVADLKTKFKKKGVKVYTNHDLERIIRTETKFIQEKAISEANKHYGIDKYKIVVTKDERTCRHCHARDGEVHLESERVMGVTSPPFHPQCRCVTQPYVEE